MRTFIIHSFVIMFLVLCFFGALYTISVKDAKETNFSTEEVLPKMGQ